MTVSSLARASIITTKRNDRYMPVTKFTPHYMCAAWSGETCAEYFRDCDRSVSANYCIGTDGGIVCNVPEEYRAWTSSSSWNDQRAITVECGNLAGGVLTDATWNSLVKLGADVMRRYGFRPWYTGDSSGTITEHMMFASTDCPGPWLHPRMGDLAVAIKNELDGTAPGPAPAPQPQPQPKPKPTVVPKPGPDEVINMSAQQGVVRRLYNPYNGDHVYSSDGAEVKSLVKAGYIDEGVVGVAPRGLADLHRFYNVDTGEHILTDDLAEAKSLLSQGKNMSDGSRHGWQYEGVAFIAYADDRGAEKLHRLYKGGGLHLLTSDPNEIETLQGKGWVDEGVKFSLDAQGA